MALSVGTRVRDGPKTMSKLPHRFQLCAPKTLSPSGSGPNPPSRSSSFGNSARYLYRGGPCVMFSGRDTGTVPR